ncbi:hypothetical protein [Kitasatospora sp. GP82]|uniref:hypothetical protein n=1 Tax=Kitasatospora sp. GP82 TaxID=3035089 RepID=UPI002475775B|nr:hypothetical protein [Kitasatospora sp. GP82]MDH6124537.1 hypothetical protein [Kitasatospora sp. GP82]
MSRGRVISPKPAAPEIFVQVESPPEPEEALGAVKKQCKKRVRLGLAALFQEPQEVPDEPARGAFFRLILA